ncbi:hypothetical protein DL767_000101 [Monosporascus sp. MG133]|nr:hypothetical protein DL767_000101 [Monosporascus sp. MG133]
MTETTNSDSWTPTHPQKQPPVLQIPRRIAREAGPVLYQTVAIGFSAGFFSSGRVALGGAGTFRSERIRYLYIDWDPGYNAFTIKYDLRCIMKKGENAEFIEMDLSPDINPRNPESSGANERLWMKEIWVPSVAYLKAMPKLATIEVTGRESERLLRDNSAGVGREAEVEENG